MAANEPETVPRNDTEQSHHRERLQSNFSMLLRQQLRDGENLEGEGMNIFFDDESSICQSKKDRKQSIADESQSIINFGDETEGNGGQE